MTHKPTSSLRVFTAVDVCLHRHILPSAVEPGLFTVHKPLYSSYAAEKPLLVLRALLALHRVDGQHEALAPLAAELACDRARFLQWPTASSLTQLLSSSVKEQAMPLCTTAARIISEGVERLLAGASAAVVCRTALERLQRPQALCDGAPCLVLCRVVHC